MLSEFQRPFSLKRSYNSLKKLLFFRCLNNSIGLRLLRRNQITGSFIRDFFSENYGVHIGRFSYGCFDPWRMPGPMIVGRYCSIAATVRSARVGHPLHTLSTHPFSYEAQYGFAERGPASSYPLVIEDDVWIGHNVILLPNCRFIGRGAVIGAGAIVTKDVERYAIVAGNPASMRRYRFDPELMLAVENSYWWELDLDELMNLNNFDPMLIFGPAAKSISQIGNLRDFVRGLIRDDG